MSTPILYPMPPPGLSVVPGYTAQQPEAYLIKRTRKHFTRYSGLVSAKDPFGRPGQALMMIDEVQRRHYQFVDASGRLLFTLNKEKHWRQPTAYRAIAPTGQIIWTIGLIPHFFRRTDFAITINPGTQTQAVLSMERKVQGQDQGIMFNGMPVATMLRPNGWIHQRQYDHVSVAPGMDITLAIGIAFCYFDQRDEEASETSGG